MSEDMEYGKKKPTTKKQNKTKLWAIEKGKGNVPGISRKGRGIDNNKWHKNNSFLMIHELLGDIWIARTSTEKFYLELLFQITGQ